MITKAVTSDGIEITIYRNSKSCPPDFKGMASHGQSDWFNYNDGWYRVTVTQSRSSLQMVQNIKEMTHNFFIEYTVTEDNLWGRKQ